MEHDRTVRRWSAGALVLLSLVFVVGCGFIGGAGATPTSGVVVRTPVPPKPTPTPSPTPTSTPAPTPTPTPVPTFPRSQAENLVWDQISPCAEQVVGAGAEGEPQTSAAGLGFEVTLTSSYDARDAAWIVAALTDDGTLTFGQWRVLDMGATVVPQDETATKIAQPGVTCSFP